MPTSVELAAAASPRAPSYFGVSAEFGRANMQARCARGTQEARPLNFVGAEIDRHAAANVSPALVFEPVLQVFRLCGKFPRKTEALTRHFAFAAKRDDEARRSADEKPLVAHCHACHRVEKLAEPASFSTFRVRPYQWQTTTSPDWMMPKRSAADPTGRFTQPWLPRPCWYNVPPNAACQSASCRPMTLPTNGIQ